MAIMDSNVPSKISGYSFTGLSWLFQRVSAVIVLGLLLFHAHFILQKFIATGAISYSDLLAVLSKPVNKAIELSLFFFGTLHGINGLWSVINIFFRNTVVKKLLMTPIIISGILFLCFISQCIVSL
jgi:succinate dehydrogenase hydrophobic anchor subunit